MSVDNPNHALFEVTSSCNYECKMCYNVWKNLNAKNNIDLDKEKKIKTIKRISKHCKNIVITGGEPTTLSYLPELIKTAVDFGMKVSLITNASLINKNYAHKLKQSGLTNIQISFHHYKKNIYNEICNKEKAFDKMILGLKNLFLYFDKESISANMVPFPKTTNDVYDVGKKLHKLGINEFVVGVPVYTGDAFKNNLKISIHDLRWIYIQLSNLYYNFGQKVTLGGSVPFCVFKNINRDIPVRLGNGCEAGRNVIAIGADGDCRACVEHSIKIGNILTDSFDDIWNSKVLSDFRKCNNLPDECLSCNLLSKCRGGCRVSACNFNGKDPYLYELNKK